MYGFLSECGRGKLFCVLIQTSCAQTFVRLFEFRLLVSSLSSFHQTFVLSYSDYRAILSGLSYVYWSFFCPTTDFSVFIFRFLCVDTQISVQSPDFDSIIFRLSCVFWCFQTVFLFRLLCIHVRIFVRSSHFLVFFDVSRLYSLQKGRPLEGSSPILS